MKTFCGADFLIHNAVGQRLYNDYAKDMPIFDYHSHLDPKEIYEDKKFQNLTELWLAHDHYKWRAMRAAGVEEAYITGPAPDREKFIRFAQVMEKLIGNPLYDWAHLELKTYFDVHSPLTAENAGAIYDRCTEMLQGDEFSARALIQRSHVTTVCTTDSPTDDLIWHRRLQQEGAAFQMLPSFRPDGALKLEDAGFPAFLQALEQREGLAICDIDDLWAGLRQAFLRFQAAGCVVADHGLEPLRFAPPDRDKANRALQNRLQGVPVAPDDLAAYQTYLLVQLAGLYTAHQVVMQLHMGVLRNNSTRLLQTLGRDAGGDSIGDCLPMAQLGRLLDTMDQAQGLPKTILYPIHPGDYWGVATMAVNFCCGKAPYYVQLGNAWWFNDSVRGIQAQLTALMETGGLPGFVGMLTDSRSLTSFTRHDFFRRILCSQLGAYVEEGGFPDHMETLGEMVRDICYRNAVHYFDTTKQV